MILGDQGIIKCIHWDAITAALLKATITVMNVV